MKIRALCSGGVFPSLFTQKYFPFSKMDKKNVQKRKPKILFKKKPRPPPAENITTDALLLYFLTGNDANGGYRLLVAYHNREVIFKTA
jgi:hypothetical protein